jgi:MOSC domain-containing protein YiiM
MRVISVNVGRTKEAEWAGRTKRTAIDKRSVDGRVGVRALGIDGDEQADAATHGGPEQAVYAYAREDYDWWERELGRPLRNGVFGENLTLSHVDVTGALLGERWRIGSALVEVTFPRIPCGVFRTWMDEPGWVKRFADAERPGAYLRVLEEGEVAAGDGVELVSRPDDSASAERVKLGEAVRAYYGDVVMLRRILDIPDHSPKWDALAARLRKTGSGNRPQENRRQEERRRGS